MQIKSQAIGTGTHDNPPGAIIMEYRYAYDAAGNITERDTEDGAYQYGYDLIDRLTQATPPQALQQDPLQPVPEKLPVEAYSYDPVHNRLTSQHQPGAWQYNADNQLLQYGIGPDQHSYTYNPNGHTATEITGDPATRTREFIYNAAERLTEIKDNGQPVGQYQYDPMGRRIKKQTSEGTTWFLYADEGLITELDQTGNPTRYYGWKPNGLWGTDPLWLADKSGSEWQTHLYHNDHLWTPQRLTDTSGEVTWSGRAEAFGKTAAIVNSVENRLRFPGQYEDGDSEIHYNWNRDYDPMVGRYSRRDPIGLDGGFNTYIYAFSSSILYFDFDGLSPCCPEKNNSQCCRESEGIRYGKADGMLVCCNGRKVACINPKAESDHNKAFIMPCLREHENEHRNRDEGEPCRECGVYPTDPNKDWHGTECYAYQKEMTCLDKTCRSAKGESKRRCLSVVAARKRFVQEHVREKNSTCNI